MNDKKSKLKILFFHNTLPEYRIGWFQCLAQEADIDFIFTNEMQNKKDYGFEIDYEKSANLKCTFLPNVKNGINELRDIMKNIEIYDFVELPPIDSIREVIYSIYIVNRCKSEHIKCGYFWEKWEAPKEKQPFERKVKNWILRIIPRLIYKQTDIIFSVGRKNRDYFISNGVNEEKIKWIPDVSETPDCNYVDLRKKIGISQDKKIVLYLGRILQQKGVRYLLRAFASLKPDVKNTTHLLIAGDGPDLITCRRLAQELKIDNITFVGAVKPSERGNYFKQCTVFVYPVTYYKGRVDVWGLTINEAIQHGKIVIATEAVGSAYELIKNNINGFILNVTEEEQIIHKIANAIEKCDDKMISAAQIYDCELMKKYSFQNMAELYLTAIKSLDNKA